MGAALALKRALPSILPWWTEKQKWQTTVIAWDAKAV
jgi:hypothetical protein